MFSSVRLSSRNKSISVSWRELIILSTIKAHKLHHCSHKLYLPHFLSQRQSLKKELHYQYKHMTKIKFSFTIAFFPPKLFQCRLRYVWIPQVKKKDHGLTLGDLLYILLVFKKMTTFFILNVWGEFWTHKYHNRFVLWRGNSLFWCSAGNGDSWATWQ